MSRVYNRKVDKFDARDHLFTGAAHPAGTTAPALPASVDLRPHCPPVYDQQQFGSCTGNAWAFIMEYLQKKNGATAVAPSRLFIYYNERLAEGDVGEDDGAQVRDGATVLSKYGAPPEALWPYTKHDLLTKPTAMAYQQALSHRLLSYQRITNGDLTAMKTCLADGLPFAFGFQVFSGLESDACAETGILTMPKAHDTNLGGHCVACVGYDDVKQVFICRNSWGVSWGDKGYFYMPYAYIANSKLSNDFWMGLTGN